MPKFICNMIFVSFAFSSPLRAHISATVKTYSDWVMGQNINGDVNSRQGQLTILSSMQVQGDEFDTLTLKPYWQLLGLVNYIFSNEKLKISRLVPITGTRAGVSTLPFPDPGNFEIETLVDTGCNSCFSGGLFLDGISPTASLANEGNEMRLYKNDILAGNVVVGRGKYFLKISKFEKILTGYYKRTSAESWISVASWPIISISPSLTAGVGVGIGPSVVFSENSEYEYFRIYPFASRATWTSSSLYLSGTPTTKGQISWKQDNAAGTDIQIQTSTSDNGIDWSPWSQPYGDSFGSIITSPSRNYIRVAATLNSDTTHRVAPILKEIDIDYPDAAPLTPVLTVPTHREGAWSNRGDMVFQWEMPKGNPAAEDNYTYWVYANGGLLESNKVALTKESVGSVHARGVTLGSEGSYRLDLQVQADAFSGGLSTTVVSYAFNFDRTPPSGAVISSPTHPELLFANNNSPVFDLKATDVMSGVSGYAVVLDKLNYGDPGSVINLWGSQARYTNLQNGTYYLHARAVDAAGNTGAVGHYGIRVDFNGNVLNAAFAKALPNPVRLDEARIEYELAAAASSVSLEFMDGMGAKLLQVDGTRVVGKNYYLWDVSKLANGVYFYRITAKSNEDGKTYVVTKKIAIIR